MTMRYRVHRSVSFLCRLLVTNLTEAMPLSAGSYRKLADSSMIHTGLSTWRNVQDSNPLRLSPLPLSGRLHTPTLDVPGAPCGDRTRRLPLTKRLLRLRSFESKPHQCASAPAFADGEENQASCLVDLSGFGPLTPCLPGRCSPAELEAHTHCWSQPVDSNHPLAVLQAASTTR